MPIEAYQSLSQTTAINCPGCMSLKLQNVIASTSGSGDTLTSVPQSSDDNLNILSLFAFSGTKRDLQKIIYFSDGAAAQYKNCKNFQNLCLHKTDFDVDAEWNFFATSHGKSPCDGIGGTVKRLVARASLQANLQHQILTPLQMYEWAAKNINGINFVYAAKKDVELHRNYMVDRFASIQTVPGTRSHHRFVPLNANKLKMFRLSSDDCGTEVNVSPEPDVEAITVCSFNDMHPYGCCL